MPVGADIPVFTAVLPLTIVSGISPLSAPGGVTSGRVCRQNAEHNAARPAKRSMTPARYVCWERVHEICWRRAAEYGGNTLIARLVHSDLLTVGAFSGASIGSTSCRASGDVNVRKNMPANARCRLHWPFRASGFAGLPFYLLAKAVSSMARWRCARRRYSGTDAMSTRLITPRDVADGSARRGSSSASSPSSSYARH